MQTVMLALSIIDFPAEPLLLPILVKMKILAKCPSHACVEKYFVLVKANMVYGHKIIIMMKKWVKICIISKPAVC